MTLQLPIEEYFRYHPPTTPERIALHERVNRESLEIYQTILGFNRKCNSGDFKAIEEKCKRLIIDCLGDGNSPFKNGAKIALQELKEASTDGYGQSDWLEPDRIDEDILTFILQFQMFLNQGITVDELKRQQLAEGMAAVTTEDIAQIFEMHGETVRPEAIDPRSFHRDYQGSTPMVGGMVSGSPEAMEKLKQSLACHEDANRVFAVSANYLADDEYLEQFDLAIALSLHNGIWDVGIAGSDGEVEFESTGNASPIAALSNLYATLKGIEFAELKNSSGEVCSTSIKSISVDTDAIHKYGDFIDAYGNTIADIDANGLSHRDRLIADLIATEDDEQIGGGT